ncbi:FAD-dependent thymidylate synthase [Candidatus Gracilibacteria bacterium]|nr:FAD-dependent thymidylate synthase [Candidatus Gracilibacteria bacterium]
MKVVLISHTLDPEAIVAAAINQCYSAKSGEELKEEISSEKRERLIDIVMNSGHLSTIEHASFTFAVEGVSRITETQLVRHRIASYSIKSGRYNKTHTNFIVPPKIQENEKARELVEKFKKSLEKTISELEKLSFKYEDMRYLTPQGTATNIIFTMNARSLLNFFEHRLCLRAQSEIRSLAVEMLKLVKPVAPNIFKFAGPTCEIEKICWEGDLSCGRWKGIKGGELRTRNVKKSSD